MARKPKGSEPTDPAVYYKEPRCKICKSGKATEINKMLIDGNTYQEIIDAFPDLKLNKQNLSNHRKHFAFIEKGVSKYKQQLEEGEARVVDSIKTLDATIEQMHNYLTNIDVSYEPPRKIEVCGDLLIRAIQTKEEILNNKDKDSSDISDIIYMILGSTQPQLPKPDIIDAEVSYKDEQSED